MVAPYDPAPKKILAILKRRMGKWQSLDDLLKADKTDHERPDSRNAMVMCCSKLEDRHGVEYKYEFPQSYWRFPEPPEENSLT